MNRLSKRASLWLAGGLIAMSAAVLAAGPDRDGPPANPDSARSSPMPTMPMPPMRHGMGMPFGPHHGLHRPLPLAALDLSEAQQDRIFALMHEQAPRQREQARAAGKAFDELQRLTENERYDAGKAAALADAYGKAQAALAANQAELDFQIRGLLTPGQKQALTKAMQQPRTERPRRTDPL